VEATALVTTPRDPSAPAHEDIDIQAVVIKDLTHHVPDSHDHRPTVPTLYASFAGAPPPPSDSALKRSPATPPSTAQILAGKPGIQQNSGMKNHS
jgi:hypothetical protein